jgi:hypothetical protein
LNHQVKQTGGPKAFCETAIVLGDRLRIAASASIAGVAAGFVAGVVARLLMRLIVVLRGEAPGFSLAATAAIVVTFIAMAGALGMTYALVSGGFRRGPAPAWWALAGLGLLACVLFLSPLRQELDRGPQFVGLFVPVGLLLGWLPAWLSKGVAGLLPETAGGLQSGGYALLAVPGVLSLVAVPMLIILGFLQILGVIPVPAN